LEDLPFFRALHDGTLSKLAIVSFLRSISILHAILDRSLSQTSDPKFSEVLKQAKPKLPFLISDLKALSAESFPSIAPAIQCALQFGDEILQRADKPLFLVGILYVFEGSQNGAAVLKHAYARCLKISPDALSFFGCYGSANTNNWKTFIRCLNALPIPDEEVNQVADAAKASYAWIEKICTVLCPYSARDLMHHVAEINFEAGNHIMPQNPVEIELALRAGKKAWDKHPYLDYRFGERGKRFTSSDSCWLVALTHMPVETATANLKWLRKVLAVRGLPTVILEGHLRDISQALKLDCMGRIGEQDRFEEFLSSLDAERNTVANGQAYSTLVARFEQRFWFSSGFKVNSASQLIASAWVDERVGISGALAATQVWFVDPGRFSLDWIANVNELVASLEGIAKPQC